MTELREVRPGKTLFWPDGYGPPGELARGGHGYVVDLDAPLEREWCKGQEYKLSAVAGCPPSEIVHPVARRAVGEWKRANDPSVTKAEVIVPEAADIMEPIEPPTKKGKGKKAAVEDAAD